MTGTDKHPTIASLLTAVVCVLAASAPARAQARGRKGLVSMIPAEALFYVERRGHEAVREAFLASNLGKMASDEAIGQFVRDSRIRIGQKIVKEMFNLETAKEIDRHQKILHRFLRPFWYRPAAAFVVYDPKAGREPGMGFICATGKYRAECKEALAKLVGIGVPAKGPGTRQAFTYRKGAAVWQGVAKKDKEFALPKDPKKRAEVLKDTTNFMVCWLDDILFIATDLPAADAMSGMLSITKPAVGKDANESCRAVMKKTAMKDWAFRWYLDVEALFKRFGDDGEPPKMLVRMGMDKVRGVGGTGGYMDKVFARLTYVYAPGTTGGLLRVLKQGGSYKRGLAMVPDTSQIFLAGQADTKATMAMLLTAWGAKSPAGATQPGTQPDEENARIVKQVQLLAEASDGNVAMFMSSIQGLMGMMMRGGPPVGAVLGLKDRDKAAGAIDKLIKLAGVEEEIEADEDEVPPKPRVYRKVTIRPLGEMVRLAILKDRAVIAMSDDAMKSVIDAAVDKTGGFRPESKGAALAKLAGDGAAVFKFDLAALAGLFWPMLMQVAEKDPDDFPLASMPSAGKMVRLLGPEIAVLEPDADGLLLKSRGKIPFATKLILALPFQGLMFFMF